MGGGGHRLMSSGGKNMKQGKRNEVPVRGKEKRRKRQGKWKEKNKTNKTKLQKTGGGNWVVNVFFFFFCFFLCSKEHFSIFFVQYLGVTAGIEPAT
jgi:hypothetical protein